MGEKTVKLSILAGILFILVMLPAVHATTTHLTLLAVTETETGFEGSTADLYLEIQPGTGRVFLETYPLSKVDTQMSTRFAKDVACEFINEDCSKYDFFYTIKADSPIIGGPSAGSSIAILTIAGLKNINIDENIAATGTINSGGLIGAIGGVKEKIDAADKAGIKKMLVPEGEAILVEEKTNESKTTDTAIIIESTATQRTINLTKYAEMKNVKLIEVGDLNDAFFEFSGKKLKEDNGELQINEKYAEVMKDISDNLCQRSYELEQNLSKGNLYSNSKEITQQYNNAQNLTKKSREALLNKEYYSAASYCFGANVKYSYASMLLKNWNNASIESEKNKIINSLQKTEQEIDTKEVKTTTDLQAKLITKERLAEAKAQLNNSADSIYNLAYAQERIFSVYSWSKFFGKGQQEYSVNKESLKQTCIIKTAEAEERYEYLKLMFPITTDESGDTIKLAKKQFSEGNYEDCIFTATNAKAESDVILSVIGSQTEQLPQILDTKLNIVKRLIIEQNQKERFPILGYSYYEYANSLKEADIFSALLYSEYALEMSNLDMYFEHQEQQSTTQYVQLIKNNLRYIFVFIAGAVFGIILYMSTQKKKKKRR